jgi:SSS family transporter
VTHFQLSASDYLVVAGYFVLLLAIGLWFRNRLKNMKDYFAGGNQVPWWMAGISHYMSSFSAFSFVAYAQIGYMYGWVSVTLFWAVVAACLAGGVFFAGRWRRARVITPVQFLELRFNGFVRQLFAWTGIPVRIFDDALKIFATGLFVSVASGISLCWSIVICGSVMVVYTFLGGVWALVVTDYIQFLMKVLAILLLCPLAIAAAGGFPAAFRGLPAGFLTPVNGPYGWPYLAGFAVLMMVSYNASWSLAQKYYSVPTDHDASKAGYLSALLNFLGAPLMILPAIVGRHFLPDLVAQNHTADAYVLLVTQLLPAGMVGIIMAAMFSATMAAVTGDFNAVASVLTQDVYHRLIRPQSTEKHLLRVGRGITLGLGALTTLLSLWIVFTHQQSLFNLMVTVLGLFMAPTLLPLLAGLVSRRLNWQGAFAGFLCGLTTGGSMLALRTWWAGAATIFGSSYNFEGVSLLANAGATILGLVAGILLFHTSTEKAEDARQFFVELDKPVQESETPAGEEQNTASVLAFSTAGVGALIIAAGLISGSEKARVIDLGVGALFAAISAGFVWSARRGRKTGAA